MTRHFDQRAIERAAVILRVAERYSGDEIDEALKAARRAIGSIASLPAVSAFLSSRRHVLGSSQRSKDDRSLRIPVLTLSHGERNLA